MSRSRNKPVFIAMTASRWDKKITLLSFAKTRENALQQGRERTTRDVQVFNLMDTVESTRAEISNCLLRLRIPPKHHDLLISTIGDAISQIEKVD